MQVVRTLLAGILFLSTPAQAELLFQYGVGVLDTTRNSLYDVKTIAVAYDKRLAPNFHGKIEGGYWNDSSKAGKSSGYGSSSIGVVVHPWIFDVRVYSGLGFVTHTDRYLGGRFQFYQNGSIGLREGVGSISLGLTHYSNAGIVQPNRGRNLLTIQVGYDL